MQSVGIFDQDKNTDTGRTLVGLRYQWSKGISQASEDIGQTAAS